MDNPRIIIFSPYTKPYYSGSGINAFSLAKQLLANGSKVLLVTFNWNLKDNLKDNYDGLKVVRIPFFNFVFLNKFFLRLYLTFIFPVFFACFRYRQIVIFGAFSGYLLLIIFSKIFGLKVVFRSTMLGVDDILSLTKNSKLRRYILGKIDFYYATNPAFEYCFLSVYPLAKGKVFLTTPGVDLERFSKHSTNIERKNNPLSIISIGNIIPRKGYIELFDNLSLLDIDFTYRILGADRPKSQFSWHSDEQMEKIMVHGKKILGSKVEFLGWIDDVVGYLESSDVFLLNSHKEGLPNSLLEAMACGVVPIVNRMDGLDDYLLFDKENSFIFDSFSELAFILTQLSQNRILLNRISNNARKTIKSNFGFSEAVKSIMSVYNK